MKTLERTHVIESNTGRKFTVSLDGRGCPTRVELIEGTGELEAAEVEQLGDYLAELRNKSCVDYCREHGYYVGREHGYQCPTCHPGAATTLAAV